MLSLANTKYLDNFISEFSSCKSIHLFSVISELRSFHCEPLISDNTVSGYLFTTIHPHHKERKLMAISTHLLFLERI